MAIVSSLGIKKITSDKKTDSQMEELLEKTEIKVLKPGDVIKGIVISVSKSCVKIDVEGIFVGIVRGPELYKEAGEYDDLKIGDEIEATVIESENEFGELELSFKVAGQEKAWNDLNQAFKDKKIIKVRVVNANKGGLMVNFRQIAGFIPVSQLSPENYPRVSGGDKTKIFEKLKTFVGCDLEVKVSALDVEADKIIFSEKDAWAEQQKHVISQYEVGMTVEGKISAVADFGVFLNFGDNMEGLIHISELAWQRIDHPSDLFKVGDALKAQIIDIKGSKMFLSAKKLIIDPWLEIEKKYKIGQKVTGKIIKVNHFGLFVELDSDIHGLSHVSQLNLTNTDKITDLFKAGEEREFIITSIQAKDHRLGLTVVKKEEK